MFKLLLVDEPLLMDKTRLSPLFFLRITADGCHVFKLVNDVVSNWGVHGFCVLVGEFLVLVLDPSVHLCQDEVHCFKGVCLVIKTELTLNVIELVHLHANLVGTSRDHLCLVLRLLLTDLFKKVLQSIDEWLQFLGAPIPAAAERLHVHPEDWEHPQSLEYDVQEAIELSMDIGELELFANY